MFHGTKKEVAVCGTLTPGGAAAWGCRQRVVSHHPERVPHRQLHHLSRVRCYRRIFFFCRVAFPRFLFDSIIASLTRHACYLLLQSQNGSYSDTLVSVKVHVTHRPPSLEPCFRTNNLDFSSLLELVENFGVCPRTFIDFLDFIPVAGDFFSFPVCNRVSFPAQLHPR